MIVVRAKNRILCGRNSREVLRLILLEQLKLKQGGLKDCFRTMKYICNQLYHQTGLCSFYFIIHFFILLILTPYYHLLDIYNGDEELR
jgi:hypothetical protein